jgi:hypothetical protein
MTAVNSPFLRRVIGVDAAACAASGLLLALGGRPLADLTGLPTALSQPAGEFLIAWAVLLAWLATRPSLGRRVVWTLIAVNAAWVVESATLLAMQWVQPTAVGYALVVGQATAVVVLAELQFMGLRRSRVVA